MKAGPNVSPVVAVVVIVLVVAIAGFFLMKATGSRKGMTAEQEAKLKQMYESGQILGGGKGTGATSAGNQQAPQGR